MKVEDIQLTLNCIRWISDVNYFLEVKGVEVKGVSAGRRAFKVQEYSGEKLIDVKGLSFLMFKK